ncbi:peptidase S8/S53 domain-containing protein [Russula earlei]|uniref:Peptidase S8/S53 domain-containing protein n=1 Tax=Russula earlei TaxID=71964 RepID=A0ACC0UJV6_9AGAM|nr:peptidase S8/S53 domain-containing protein [Russula earlei]
MRLPFSLFLLLSHFAAGARKHTFDTHDYYILEHDPLVGPPLSQVASHLGVQVVEPAGELDNFWVVRIPKQGPSTSPSERDGGEDRVYAALEALRSTISARDPSHHVARSIANSVKHLARQELRQRVKRAPPPIYPSQDDDDHALAQPIMDELGIHDPLFPAQWHIINEKYPEHAMNVTRLWEKGITGVGIVTALVDDGLDYEHEDIADNFWAPGSYDYNDHQNLPTPKLPDDRHGTRCAGQIAGVKNTVCGVGIAYDSKVSGVRILSGSVSDIDEAAALNFHYQNTSIYSCSWGPADNGKSMESPSYVIERAILNGVQNGRDGKGSIFVFASGNGARHADQCNFDGYTNSIYSVTISAVDLKGLHPPYSEPCAANLLVAYSSGSGNHIVTTDRGKGRCTNTHGGTSAAAPNAAAVFALALSVRPELTWRDMQHLAVRTAEIINPDDPDWEKTAAGRHFSYKYGYGRLNGYEFVTLAQEWELVKPQAWVELPAVQVGNGKSTLSGDMSGGLPIVPGGTTSTFTITSEDLERNNFDKLEHITVRVWIKHHRRGDVEVEVTSPNEITSILAARRRLDADKDGFPGWRFMSVKHWDEDPRGTWTLRVSDIGAEGRTGHFVGWQLALYGSTKDPSLVQEYQLSLFEKLLPSLPSPNGPSGDNDESPSSTTKVHPKPTDHLPGDHGETEGEADKPAFHDDHPANDATKPSITATASATMIPTADEGWFSDMSTLVSNQKWVFGAASIVIMFGIAAGIFLCRRSLRRRRPAEHYSALPGDEVALGAMSHGRRGPRTKELYDAFGEHDDDDSDENTALRVDSPGGAGPGLEFHEGFLDDEDPNTPRTALTSAYRDEPEKDTPSRGAASPSRSGSGDGSWEHAS